MVGHVGVEVTWGAHVSVVVLANGSLISGTDSSVYGIFESRCEMQLSRARFFVSDSTTYQGASGMSVCTNISSLARE